MSVNTKSRERKPGVSTPIVIGLFILLFLWVGWLYYHNFVPPSHPIGPTPESKHDWIAQEAVKAGGDFNKVDPGLQKRLNMFTGGKGADLIKSKYYSATH